jgi:hypothetical protein
MDQREIKFRVHLKALEDIPESGYLKGETCLINNLVFNRDNGLAFWPIDRRWEILYYIQFSGLCDMDGMDIYEGDVLSYHNCKGAVRFENGKFLVRMIYKDRQEVDFHLCNTNDITTVIGNIFTTPELITNP